MINVVEKVKALPPALWLVGGALIVGWFVLRGGGSTGSAGVASSGAGGGGGADRTELDNLSAGLVQLADDAAKAAADEAEWRKKIEEALKAGAPTNTNKPSTHRYGSDLTPAIRARFSVTSLEAVVRKAGVDYGTVVNIADLKKALRKEGINYGSTVDVVDILKLYAKVKLKPTAPKP